MGRGREWEGGNGRYPTRMEIFLLKLTFYSPALRFGFSTIVNHDFSLQFRAALALSAKKSGAIGVWRQKVFIIIILI